MIDSRWMTDMSAKPRIPGYLQDRIAARKRHGLSHAYVGEAQATMGRGCESHRASLICDR
jgi:hypothetical protein